MSLNKRRAAALIDQAELHRNREEWAAVVPLATAALDSSLVSPRPYDLLAEAHARLGAHDAGLAAVNAGLKRFPADPVLVARAAVLAGQAGDHRRAVELFSKVRAAISHNAVYRTRYAFSLLHLGRLEEAEAQLAAALLTGGGEETHLIIAAARAFAGRFEEAEALALRLESESVDGAVRGAALAFSGDVALLRGDGAAALSRFDTLAARGGAPKSWSHALAAALAGDWARADALAAKCAVPTLEFEGHLALGQLANLRDRPAEALEHLARAPAAPGDRGPWGEGELALARARALRLRGQADDAKAALAPLTTGRDASSRRLGGLLALELGLLAAMAGAFEEADRHFAHALELDPRSAEATAARENNAKRLGYRVAISASAQARVDAARADADALKQRYRQQESELERLRHELEGLKKLKESAEERAQEAEAEADHATSSEGRHKQLHDELASREADAQAKAVANLELALGDDKARCPEPVWRVFLVAERTYQQALYTELPAAAVAVLYCGALERSLSAFLVTPFDLWLGEQRRAAFLASATRGKRGKRVEYFDRFVESFDKSLGAKPPALGEVQRVLERRDEPYLRLYRTFLVEQFNLAPPFYDALAAFVLWTKERLRDPVAHGQAADLGYEDLRKLREQLLVSFDGGRGLLAQLVGGQR